MESVKVVNRSFHYSERLKSNLLIAMRAMDRIAELEGFELEGGLKVMRAIFEALGTELGIARSHLVSKEFNLVVTKVMEAQGHTDLHEFEKARESLTEALCHTTALSSRYLTALTEKRLI